MLSPPVLLTSTPGTVMWVQRSDLLFDTPQRTQSLLEEKKPSGTSTYIKTTLVWSLLQHLVVEVLLSREGNTGIQFLLRGITRGVLGVWRSLPKGQKRETLVVRQESTSKGKIPLNQDRPRSNLIKKFIFL